MNEIVQFYILAGEWIDRSFASLLLDAAVKSLFVLALAWSATQLMRNRSAAARHLVWCAASIAILIIPILSLALPTWRALPPSMNAALYLAPLPVVSANTTAGPAARQSKSAQIAPAYQIPDAAMLLFIGWMIGAVAFLLPMMVGQMRLWKFKRRCSRNATDELYMSVHRISQELGIDRPVQLLIADEPLMPMTWGILQAKLVLPRDAQDWPPVRRNAVLLHELSHVKRLDCLTHLIAQLARAIYWFNPLAWVAVRRMETAREHACDDLVIGGGIRQTDYAREILEIVTAYPHESANRVAMPIIRASAVEQRVREILNNHLTRGSLTMRHILITATLLTTIVLPIAMLRAEDAPVAPKPTSQPAADPAKDRDQMIQVAGAMRQIMLGCIIYANDHHAVLPNDLGELVPDFHKQTAESISKLFSDPRNPVEAPKEMSADWINEHSPWVYLGANMSLVKMKDIANTIIIHSDLDKPFGNLIVAGYADGHAQVLELDLAKTAIEQSKQNIEKARAENGK